MMAITKLERPVDPEHTDLSLTIGNCSKGTIVWLGAFYQARISSVPDNCYAYLSGCGPTPEDAVASAVANGRRTAAALLAHADAIESELATPPKPEAAHV